MQEDHGPLAAWATELRTRVVRLGGQTGDFCSTDFSVTNGSQQGITTAGHCHSMDQVSHDGWTHGSTYFNQHIGSWGDVEWHTTATDDRDTFTADYNEARYVYSVKSAAAMNIGDTVCFQSPQRWEKFCQTIRYLNATCTHGGNTISKLVVMNGALGLPGDSGAPRFLNNTAYGIHEGYCVYDSVLSDQFSVAAYFNSAIGVSVMLH